MSKLVNSVINNTIIFGSRISNTKTFASVVSNIKYMSSVVSDFTSYATWIVNFREKSIVNAVMTIISRNSLNIVLSNPITVTYMQIKQQWKTTITSTLTMIPNFITLMNNKVSFVERNTIVARLVGIFRLSFIITSINTIVANVQIKRLRTLSEWDGNTLQTLDSHTLDYLDWEIS